MAGLKKCTKDEEVAQCAFVAVKSLTMFIIHTIDYDPAGFSDDELFGRKWWLLFSRDKGGSHMKFHLEVVNSKKSGSVDNVHLNCLFEATDTQDNMRKVWVTCSLASCCKGEKLKSSLEVIAIIKMT